MDRRLGKWTDGGIDTTIVNVAPGWDAGKFTRNGTRVEVPEVGDNVQWTEVSGEACGPTSCGEERESW